MGTPPRATGCQGCRPAPPATAAGPSSAAGVASRGAAGCPTPTLPPPPAVRPPPPLAAVHPTTHAPPPLPALRTWVQPSGQQVVRSLDILGAGVPAHSQQLVIVVLQGLASPRGTAAVPGGPCTHVGLVVQRERSAGGAHPAPLLLVPHLAGGCLAHRLRRVVEACGWGRSGAWMWGALSRIGVAAPTSLPTWMCV